MSPRYTVRANHSGGYCVWDAEKNAIANSPDGRQCDDLRLYEALNLTDQLIEQADKTPE